MACSHQDMAANNCSIGLKQQSLTHSSVVIELYRIEKLNLNITSQNNK
jgi:hypothetical protein